MRNGVDIANANASSYYVTQKGSYRLNITNTNTGVFFDYSEKLKLKNVLLGFYNQFLEGKLQSYGVGLQKYSRKNLTKDLSQLINSKI